MKNVLIFRGGWNGHNPVETSDIIGGRLREHGLHVDIFDTQDCLLDPDFKSKYNLVVPVWTMGTIGGEHEKALLAAIHGGMACGGWHGGMGDAFRNNTEYQFMVGGQWVAHPGGIVDYEVKLLSYTGDPIIEGIEDFKMRSEQYYMHVDPSNETLAVSILGHQDEAPWIKGCIMPAVWKRKYGEGRVFYSSLGHCASDFDVPEVLEILKRGMVWAAR